MILSFKENGVLELSLGDELKEATWSQEENEFTYTIDSKKVIGELENDKIKMEIDGAKYELIKK